MIDLEQIVRDFDPVHAPPAIVKVQGRTLVLRGLTNADVELLVSAADDPKQLEGDKGEAFLAGLVKEQRLAEGQEKLDLSTLSDDEQELLGTVAMTHYQELRGKRRRAVQLATADAVRVATTPTSSPSRTTAAS